MNRPQDTIDPAAHSPHAEVYRAARQDKPWGHELIFAAVEGKYVGKIIHVEAGHSLSLQYHREKEETISMLTGEAVVLHGPAVVHGAPRLAGRRRPARGCLRAVGHQRALTAP